MRDDHSIGRWRERATGADSSLVGWQDRDYAKWTDDDRKRYLGGGSTSVRQDGPSAGKALAIGISLVAVVGGSALHFGIPFGSSPTPTRPPAVTPQPLPGKRLVCTEESTDPATGQPRCSAYVYVTTDATPT